MRATTSLAIAIVTSLSLAPAANAASIKWWDRNGATPGAGTSLSGTWDTVSGNWATDAAGTISGLWADADTAIFSAGTDATGPYTITLSGARVVAGLTVEEGTVTLTGNTVTFSSGNVNVNSGAALIYPNSGTLVGAGAGKVVLNGGRLRNTNPGNAGAYLASTLFLEIGPQGGTVDYTSSGSGVYSIYAGTILGTGTLTKESVGEIRYQGAGTANSTFTRLIVKQGLFRLGNVPGSNDERGFGAVPASFTPDAITLDGGSIGMNYSTNLHPNRGITVTANNGGIDTSVGSFLIPAPVTGPGTLSIGPGNPGAVTFAGDSTFGGLSKQNNGPLIIGANLTVTNLFATNSITITNGKSLTLINDNPATYTGQFGGAGGFQKDGAGVLTISGFHWTNSGPVTIRGGTLRYGAATAGLGANSTVTIAAGAQLDMNNFNDSFGALAGSGDVKNVPGGTSALHVGGNGASTEFAGVISGATGNLEKLGAGVLQLSGANTYGGRTTISGGTLQLGAAGVIPDVSSVSNAAAGTLDLNGYDETIGSLRGAGWVTNSSGPGAVLRVGADGSSTTYSGVAAGPLDLVKIGSGTLTLGGDNVYTGNTTNAQGVLSIDGTVTTPFGSAASSLVFAGGNLLVTADRGVGVKNLQNPVLLTANSEIQGNNTTGIRNVVFGGPLNGENGTLTLHHTGGVGSGLLAVRFTNAFSFPQPIAFAKDSGGNAVLLSCWNEAGAGDQVFSGVISGPGLIDRGVNTSGVGGRVVFTEANTYTGGTALSDGEIALGIDSTGPADNPASGPLGTGPLVIATARGKLSAAGGPRVLGNHVAMSGSPLGLVGQQDLELSGNIDLGSMRTFQVDNTGTTVFSGVLSNGGITKSGNGLLVLTGSNSYEGATVVSSGVLRLGAAERIPDGSDLTIDGTFDLNGFTETVDGLNGSGLVTGGGTLTIGASNEVFGAFAGTIVSGSLHKVGTGKQVLGSASTYDGGTIVTAGTLEVTNLSGSATGSGSVTVQSGAELAGNGSVDGLIELAGTISPGPGPARLATGSEIWLGAGSYRWQINHATNGPGIDPGWDLLTIAGSLDVRSSATNPFLIEVVSLATNVPGLIEGLDPASSNAWTIVRTSEGITNFVPAAFQIVHSAFSNDLAGRSFTLSLANDAKDLVLALKSKQPPVLAAIPDVTIDELSLFSLTNSATTEDPGAVLTFSLLAAPSGMSINPLTGVITWTPTELQGPSVFPLTVVVTDDSQSPLSVSNTFTVTVNEVNTPPLVNAPENRTIEELTSLEVNVTATDSDYPANVVSYSLAEAPIGMHIDGNTGTILWTPAEAQGPGIYTIAVIGTDNGVPPLSATNSFTVEVTEVNNAAPILTPPPDQTIAELTALDVVATATDADIPSTVTFELLSAPTGMSIIAESGRITWVPTEAQGPSTNLVVIVVTDSGSPPLSATNSFTVEVTEVNNAAPTLTPPPDQTIAELTTLDVLATATDADIPSTVTFELQSAPAGMSIVAESGRITWVPTEGQGPSTNVVVIVATDSGSPPLSATNSFTVEVTEVNNAAPTLTPPPDQTIAELTTLDLLATATDADIPSTVTFELLSAPAGMSIIAESGQITWVPTEGQGPSTNVVVIVATDSGSPPLSATNSFTVEVTEVNNAAPTLTPPPHQTIAELTPLDVVATATDADIPSTVTFELQSAPTGMSIIAESGRITWVPTEAQGPSTNVVVIVATDSGSPPLSATNSFVVVVLESNSPPELAAISDRVVHAGTLLIITNHATDPDFPANVMRFSLDPGAPATGTVDEVTGVLLFPTSEADAYTTNVFTVRVADDGDPSLADTKSFVVIVVPALNIDSISVSGDVVTLSWATIPGQIYRVQYRESLVEGSWVDLTPAILALDSQASATDQVTGVEQRFYRILANDN